MKYRPHYPYKGYLSLDDARNWVRRFVRWYNQVHLHSGINFITPYQRHYGLDKKIMKNRIKVYENAKAKNPSRWSKDVRDWTLPVAVALNSLTKEEMVLAIKKV